MSAIVTQTVSTAKSIVFNAPKKATASDRVKRCFWNVIHTLTATFTEFGYMVFSAAIMHRGKKKPYQYCGLNPQKLTKEQAMKPAFVYLNGLFHNSTGAHALAEEFQKEGIAPFFAPNMKYNTKNPEVHHKVLRKDLKAMKALYDAHGMPMEIVCIGHSYGTKTAVELLDKPIKGITIKKIITLAGRIRADHSCHPSLKPEIEKVEEILKSHPEVALYHIIAGKDYLLSRYSAHYAHYDPKNCHIVKNRSHLGVIYAKEALKTVVEFAKA